MWTLQQDEQVEQEPQHFSFIYLFIFLKVQPLTKGKLLHSGYLHSLLDDKLSNLKMKVKKTSLM